jgi:hypothetical protein
MSETNNSNSTPCSAWFVLYDGSSPDGRGQGQFCGRTTDPHKALEHFKECKSNPYSTGSVLIVTDKEEGRAWQESCFQPFLKQNPTDRNP